MKRATNTVGVIVARFQVANLHAGHHFLINTVRSRHRRTLIVLGEHGGQRTDHDPLTFEERAEMISETYGDVMVKRLRDHPYSNDRWSVWLDELVDARKAVMYGSRGGFLESYSGAHTKRYLQPFDESSGTATRNALTYSASMRGREAIILTQTKRHPIAYSTNDVVIVDDRQERVLLGTKHWYDGMWSFLGGFLDPEKDITDEDGALRERGEEVKGIKVSPQLTQIGSRIKIDDPRYRASKDKIFTTLWRANYLSGEPSPADDIKGVRWFERSELHKALVPWHQPLYKRLDAHWKSRAAA